MSDRFTYWHYNEEEPEVTHDESRNCWIVTQPEMKGSYLGKQGYWLCFTDDVFRWEDVEFTSEQEATEALAKNAFIEGAQAGSSWRLPDNYTPSCRKRRLCSETAERWLRVFADLYRIDYDDLIKGAATGQGGCFGTEEGPDAINSAEFWRCLSKVTSKRFTKKQIFDNGDKFHCAC